MSYEEKNRKRDFKGKRVRNSRQENVLTVFLCISYGSGVGGRELVYVWFDSRDSSTVTQ